MLSFVTLTYSGDYPLLALQARSMARFLDPDTVASISVILNDVDEAGLRRKIAPLLPLYGPLRDRVRLVGGDEILRPHGRRTSPRLFQRLYVDHRSRIPFVWRQGWRGNNGYRMQQALKLASARCALSDRMVLLDAKNLLLRQAAEADFFDETGRARLEFLKPRAVYHRNWLAESLRALGLGIGVDEVGCTTTFATPYPVNRGLLLGLLDDIDARFGSVQALFASRRRPSEFMLINAYCIKHFGSPEHWFESAQPVTIGLWPGYSEQKIAQELDRLDRPDALSLGLHNRVVAMLSPAQRACLFAQLEARGICTRAEAARILDATGGLPEAGARPKEGQSA